MNERNEPVSRVIDGIIHTGPRWWVEYMQRMPQTVGTGGYCNLKLRTVMTQEEVRDLWR